MSATNTAAELLSALPLRHPAHVIGDRHVLVIAPHPDDETLGCGGLLAWAAATRRSPRVLFLTDGEQSHPASAAFPPERLAQVRRQEAVEACQALGISDDAITFLGLPDSGLEALGDAQTRKAVQSIRDWIMKSSRAAVCVTAKTDRHSDHVAAHRLTSDALRGRHQHRLLAYPVWTWFDSGGGIRVQGWRIDIASFRAKKCLALARYRSQQGELITDAPHAFALPRELMERAQQSYEVLLDAQV
jgi:LmbE family N-acetylglucosaminyl deacetylase